VSNLTPDSLALIDHFSRQPDVTADQARNLRAILDKSPTLTHQFNDAVGLGHLQHIVPLTDPHAGGTYHPNDKAIHFSLVSLTTPSPAHDPFQPGEATFVLGHELQHSFNAAEIAEANRNFGTAIETTAKSASLLHDYTPAIADLLAANRRDEASAELAGWNAIISAVKADRNEPTLKDIYNKAPGRMADFFEKSERFPYTYTLKSNLSLNDDFTLSATHEGVDNVEAMGQNFFDKAPSEAKLGRHGNSDYANFYGTSALDWAMATERAFNPPRHGVEAPRMALNLAQLHLARQLLEENGLDLRNNTQPLPYQDLGSMPPTLDHFHHTLQTHTDVPDAESTQAREEPAPGFGFYPRTATDDFLERYCQAARRDDASTCAGLAEWHGHQPHMQAAQQWGHALYESQQQQHQLQAQQLEQERQQALQMQQPTQEPARAWSR
jgi:hypothetical protein